MSKAIGPIKPEHIIEIVLRRRWFIIIPFCLSMIVGGWLAITLPKVYQSKTLILVEPQRVPTSYVQTLVSSDIDARISTIKQQIMSRTNLETIIKQFKLFSEPEYEKVYLEDKLSMLRKRISVTVTRARKGADAFSISFEGNEPEKVMNITNTLASFFIDENLKLRESQAIGTSAFIDSELNMKRKRLEKIEESLKEYERKYMGELPEQLQTNLSVLNRLQEQLLAKQENLRNTKNTLLVLEKQISEMQNIQNDVSILTTDSMPEGGAENSTKLYQLEGRLSYLKTKYTEKHPDVVRLKSIIGKLTEQKENEVGEIGEEPNERPLEFNYQALQEEQRTEIKREIQEMKAEILKLQNQINTYQKRVDNTPKREQELLSLKRDYKNIQSIYNSLLNRKLEAEISVNMEKKQKGEQFRILDPARLPIKPISPNVKTLFILTLVAGLGLGGGLIFMLEFLDTSFRRPEDLVSYIGVPVLATVPVIYHPKDKRRQRLNQILSIFSITIAFVLVAGFAVLAVKGVDQTREFASRFIKI